MSRILLVAPPMTHPAIYSHACRRTATVLRRSGGEVYNFHAGADFIAYIMQPDVGNAMADRLRRRSEKGRFADVDSATAILAAAYARAPHNRPAPPHFPSDLRTDDFFDPPAAAPGLHRIDQALMGVSLTYAPLVIDRRSVTHPGLHHSSDLLGWSADAERNPFLAYARDGCRPPIAPALCERIIFVLDQAGQAAGALTLARAWRPRAPKTVFSFLASDDHLAGIAEWLTRHFAEPPASAQADTWWRQVRSSICADSRCADAREAPPLDDPGLLMPAAPAGSAPASRVHALRLQRTGQALSERLPPEHAGTLVWEDPQGEPDQLSALLYRAGKRGFWNHVVLPHRPDRPLIDQLVRFARANPNIVHSWCLRTVPASRYSDARHIYPEGSPPYGATRPLPGVPFWQRLQDPVYLNAYVARHGAKRLARMFLMPGDSGMYVAGDRMAYHFMPPDRLPPGHLDEIVRMVEAGGSVQPRYVRHNLERAFLIGYVEENGVIIGNSSLKHPREAYIEAVSRQVGIDLRGYLERGYTSVRPEYRSLGVGAKLLEGLTARAEGYKVYSIIAEDNVATQKMAVRNRTRRVAVFFSERSNKQIGIWIPEWMLPQGIELPPQPVLE